MHIDSISGFFFGCNSPETAFWGKNGGKGGLRRQPQRLGVNLFLLRTRTMHHKPTTSGTASWTHCRMPGGSPNPMVQRLFPGCPRNFNSWKGNMAMSANVAQDASIHLLPMPRRFANPQ